MLVPLKKTAANATGELEAFGVELVYFQRPGAGFWNRLIRRESLRETDQVPPGSRSSAPTPDKVAENVELRALLEGALAELPEVRGGALQGRTRQGRSHHRRP